MLFRVLFYAIFCIAYFVVNFLNVSFSKFNSSVGEERAVVLLSTTFSSVVSVRRGFSFLLLLRMIGCIILS